MSFDVFIQRFESGEPVPLDPAAVLTALAQARTEPPPVPDNGYLRLKTADGGADIYDLSPSTSSLMLDHIDGMTTWETIWNIAHATNAAILTAGGPAIVTKETRVDHLPPELRKDAVRVDNAGLLMRAATTT
ncbi:MAG: hypothetical protein GY946_26050 [bacterium]|nr:hypothetical protein [bacterium]